MRKPRTLSVENFAQIREATIEFGDLTVLVGPQGSGKSLLLQIWKLALDDREIVRALREAGHDPTNRAELLDVYFGQGMSGAWSDDTRVLVDREPLVLEKLGRGRGKDEGVFFIPAHRALLLSEGWPAPFLKLNADTPAVARLFSQNLYTLFGREPNLFPQERRLKKEYREAIDNAVFHGGAVRLGKDQLKKRLELEFKGAMSIPFMAWTSGQREFTPLLLGLYHLLVPRKQRKRHEIDWVVIEDPEMGLHPQAVTVVMLLVLDLLWRGYRVAISTHSPLVIDVLFALRTLREKHGDPALLCDAFGIGKTQAVVDVMRDALAKDVRTFYTKFEKGGVVSRDISDLDPGSPDEDTAGWGGLTEFSGHFNRAVARAASAA